MVNPFVRSTDFKHCHDDVKTLRKYQTYFASRFFTHVFAVFLYVGMFCTNWQCFTIGYGMLSLGLDKVGAGVCRVEFILREDW